LFYIRLANEQNRHTTAGIDDPYLHDAMVEGYE
jgi:hypothetical protein